MSNPEIFNYEPDNLLVSGETGYQTTNISLASGKLSRGTLMAAQSVDPDTNVVTVVQIDLAATDGTQNPFCILANDTDATAGAVRCVGYQTGTFNSRSVILPVGNKVSDVYLACANANIYLNYAQPNE